MSRATILTRLVRLQECEYTIKVQRTGRADFFTTLVVDTSQFSPPAKFAITIP